MRSVEAAGMSLLVAAAIAALSGCDGYCPAEATSCPSSCSAVETPLYHLGPGCMEPQRVVGCVNPPKAADAAVRCIRREADGALGYAYDGGDYRLIDSPSWSACTEKEIVALQNAQEREVPACR